MMLTIEKIDTTDRCQVRRFIDVPFQIYKDSLQWVPPIRVDMRTALNRNKHPFYEHSTADFFLARRDGRDVGRVAAIVNRNYNAYHGSRMGQFYFFDCEDDSGAAAALFERVFDWCRELDLDKVVGPKGINAFDGYGLLERGFEHRQMMTMMNYNHPYYLRLVEESGFKKELDFVSHYIETEKFVMPDRVHRIAERVRKRQNLRVVRFNSRRDLRKWSDRIGRAYNNAFVENWEYVPLTDRELDFVISDILVVANPKLFKIIAHEDEVAGFAFGWPDVSAALQRSQGRLFPLGMLRLLLELRRSKSMAANGVGMLPQYQGRGGNALLYAEMVNSMSEFGFVDCELTQVAESAERMRRDLETLGGLPYKNHRVFSRML